MNKPQIMIFAGNNWYEFSISKTGQLDYVGKWLNNDRPAIEGYQKIASSTYFTPSWYTYLQNDLNVSPVIYVHPQTDISNRCIYEYLLHIGPVLAAVEAKDSLLAGELYTRRRKTFDNYFTLTQFILEPIAVEVLFSLSYGRMNNVNAEETPVFRAASKKMNFEPSVESLNHAFVRYFKSNKTVTITVEVVGNSHHKWTPYSEYLENLTSHLNCEDLTGHAEKIRSARHNFYASLETAVQAEPYNPADSNAIAVFIEGIDSKISGYPGLEKAGYVRALAAEVLREAKPEKMAYSAKLFRIAQESIVIQLTV